MQTTLPELNTITVGDALAFVSALPDTSVPLYLFSPPYNLNMSPSGDGKFYRLSKGGKSKLYAGYDENEDSMPWEEYVAWQKKILSECWRTLVDDGAIFFNHKPRIMHKRLWTPLELNPGLPLRQIVIWDRGCGVGLGDGHYCSVAEWMLVFTKPGFRFPSRAASAYGDVWSIPPEKENAWHPAPFPLALAERVIETTMPAFVVDPFVGSGTTAVAAKKYGVSYLGNDKSSIYAEKARAWVARTRKMTLRQATIIDALADQEAFA
jgi:modification methylase